MLYHLCKQKMWLSLTYSVYFSVQWVVSAASLSHSDCTQGAKILPWCNPLPLAKGAPWLNLAHAFCELGLFKGDTTIIGDISTAFVPHLPEIFFSMVVDHGIYHQEAVPIFLSSVMQAGQSLQEHSVTGGPLEGAWPASAGKSRRELLTVTC